MGKFQNSNSQKLIIIFQNLCYTNVTHQKTQETSTKDLIKCFYYLISKMNSNKIKSEILKTVA
jgi:hypothetical protein